MRRGLCTVAVVATLAVACQRSQDRAAERLVEKAIEAHGREAKVAIDRQHGSITVTLGGVVRPEGWPESIPLYPKASRAKVETKSGDARSLSLASDDSPAVLSEFYRKELTRAGWELPSTDPADHEWSARRHGEALRLRFAPYGNGRGSRAEIEYRLSS
jgi:hypothetical protein